MRKFILVMLLLVAGVFAADRAVGFAYSKIMTKSKNNLSVKLHHLCYEANEDIVLFGTSRCYYHYVPSILQDTLNLTVFNGGIDGSYNICSHYFLFCNLLERHSPKTIIIDIGPYDYSTDEGDNIYSAISAYASHIGNSKDADSVYINSGSYLEYNISHTYRYNSNAISAIGGLFINTFSRGDNGYSPLECSKTPLTPYSYELQCHKDERKIKLLYKIITKCNEKGIQLIFITSPRLVKDVKKEIFEPIEEIAKQHEITYINYLTLFSDHPEYFKDHAHLCDYGAREFSKIIAHDLKGIICDK